MSIREIFQRSSRATPLKSDEELTGGIESSGYLQQHSKDKSRLKLGTDFSQLSNFVKYGSAQRYYQDSFKRIYQSYPFDGSLSEKLEWENNSTDFDLYVFENLYPRTTGYIEFGKNWVLSAEKTSGNYIYAGSLNGSYIKTKGVMNTGPVAFNDVKSGFPTSNKFDPSVGRSSNLQIDPDTGITVEFWYKTAEVRNSATEVFVDIGNDTGGGFVFQSRPNKTAIEYSIAYSSLGLSFAPMSLNPVDNHVIDYTKWNHYSLRVKNDGANFLAELFINGELYADLSFAGPGIASAIDGAMAANIGALRDNTIVSFGAGSEVEGYGLLSGSLDEFRFWKIFRTQKEIKRFWFTQVGGGTNTDTSNTDLGFYYKFNEGITNSDVVDRNVLDYSGRNTNGTIINYSLGSTRNVSSAIDEVGHSKEFRDPIMYPFSSEVLERLRELSDEGVLYDHNNTSALYHSFPEWITEEDGESGESLKTLVQILASYFDTLHLQIEETPRLKNIHNASENGKPYHFYDKVLSSSGFIAPEVFANIEQLSHIHARGEESLFEEKLHNIKNMIYQNVYDNLVGIFKSKGTERAYESIIRSFGVDTNLVRINHYADEQTLTLEDGHRSSNRKQKFADFNKNGNHIATVFSRRILEGDPTALSPLTVEAEVVFPLHVPRDDDNYIKYNLADSCIFGMHGAITPLSPYVDGQFEGSLNWPPIDNADIQVLTRRSAGGSDSAKFVVTSPLFDDLETEIVEDLYNGDKWMVSLAIRPLATRAQLYSVAPATSYVLELECISLIGSELERRLFVSRELPDLLINGSASSEILSSPKRIFLGAHRQDFAGVVLTESDVKISSARVWLNELTTKDLISHLRDPYSYSLERPCASLYDFEDEGLRSAMDSLVFHWNFDTIENLSGTTSFLIDDLAWYNKKHAVNWQFSNITNKEYVAHGYSFSANSAFDVDFAATYVAHAPDNALSSNMVQVRSLDDITFTWDSRPVSYTTFIEKSFYANISDEMFKWMSGIVEFNNLLGDGHNRYTMIYRDLSKLASVFFERVENDPDLERFIEYYKWLDGALMKMLEEISPASAVVKTSENTIESHALERSKYWNKFPTLEAKDKIPEATIGNYSFLGDVDPRTSAALFLSGIETDSVVFTEGSRDRSIIPEDNKPQPALSVIDMGYEAFEIIPAPKKKNQITSRFSAPGSINETSLGFLDRLTTQFAIYSTNNYRNLAARKIYNKRLAAKTEKP